MIHTISQEKPWYYLFIPSSICCFVCMLLVNPVRRKTLTRSGGFAALYHLVSLYAHCILPHCRTVYGWSVFKMLTAAISNLDYRYRAPIFIPTNLLWVPSCWMRPASLYSISTDSQVYRILGTVALIR